MAADNFTLFVICDRILIFVIAMIFAGIWWWSRRKALVVTVNDDAASLSLSSKDFRMFAAMATAGIALMAAPYAILQKLPAPRYGELGRDDAGGKPKGRYVLADIEDATPAEDEGFRQEFNALVLRGTKYENLGRTEQAAEKYLEAIEIGDITSAELAPPMIGLARTAQTEGRAAEALVYGRLAAVHLRDSTEDINVVANILIDTCHLSDALDLLSALPRPDERSRWLIAAAGAANEALACAKSTTSRG